MAEHQPESQNEIVRHTLRLARAISRRDLMRTALAGSAAVAAAGGLRAASVGAAGGSGTRSVRALAQDETPVAGGTLLVGVTGQPDTMDPHKATIYTLSRSTTTSSAN